MLDHRHLGDGVGEVEQLRFGVAPGHDDVQRRRLAGEECADLVERQVAVPEDDVQLVEQDEVVARRIAVAGLDHLLRRLPCRPCGADVPGAVLGLPREPLAHGADIDPIRKTLQDRALAGLPLALHVLHDACAHAVADRARDEAERRGGLPLPLPGVDDEQALLAGLGGEDPVARGLALARLLVGPAVDLLLVRGFVHLGRPCGLPDAARAGKGERRRGVRPDGPVATARAANGPDMTGARVLMRCGGARAGVGRRPRISGARSA